MHGIGISLMSHGNSNSHTLHIWLFYNSHKWELRTLDNLFSQWLGSWEHLQPIFTMVESTYIPGPRISEQIIATASKGKCFFNKNISSQYVIPALKRKKKSKINTNKSYHNLFNSSPYHSNSFFFFFQTVCSLISVQSTKVYGFFFLFYRWQFFWQLYRSWHSIQSGYVGHETLWSKEMLRKKTGPT